ncbi:MAG: serine hydrolase domain-containing protein [Caulobacteraceae bacterium]
MVSAPPAQAASQLPVAPVFADMAPTSPGCAVGVQEGDAAPSLMAFGSADLEHAVPNTPSTVFEAGSVSKQFTATAILLLAEDGRLSLKDDVRKYIPELPAYGRPITIDQLLTHTSGLRDWGDVEAISGWPRGDRVYGLEDVLRVMRRQDTLNYEPGARWSYTNTGYNLAAIIVQRVAGQSLANFSRARIFQPLGMSHTQWRTQFRQVVVGRAIAYKPAGQSFLQDMPFENAYGNGGLLTTVGDLLIWNHALAERRLGAFVTDELQRPAILNDGHVVGYGRGLFLDRHDGEREVAHPGATAGYRAWLGRYPGRALSLALLCNNAGVDTVARARAVADLYLSRDSGTPQSGRSPSSGLLGYAGWYADDRSGAPVHLEVENGKLRREGGPWLMAQGNAFFLGTTRIRFMESGRLQMDAAGDSITLAPMKPYQPTQAALLHLVGRYRSDEAEVTYAVSLVQGVLHVAVEERPSAQYVAEPVYKDAYRLRDDLIMRPVENARGQTIGIRLSTDRVWSLLLRRLG